VGVFLGQECESGASGFWSYLVNSFSGLVLSSMYRVGHVVSDSGIHILDTAIIPRCANSVKFS